MDPEIALLLDSLRDGDLDASDRASLARTLRADPALAARVHADLRLEGQLAGLLRPLDDSIWQAIEVARVVAADNQVADGVLRRISLPPRRGWWAWGLAASVLALAIGAALGLGNHQPSMRVTVAMTDERADSTEHQAASLASPLTCSDDQHAQLAFSDGTSVEVASASVVRLASMDRGGAQLELTKGSLQAVVAKQLAGAHFVVHTKEAVLTVLGTRFSATRFPWGTRVEVAEGRVLTHQITGGAETVVPAGMRVDVGMDPSRPLAPVPLQPPMPAGAVLRVPVADAIVIAGRRAHENRGGVPSHLLTSLEAPTDERREFYLRFDLTGIHRPVSSARLYLHVNHLTYLGMRCEVAEVADTTWNEMAITWETRPKAGTVVGTWSPGQDDAPIDLTAAVNAGDALLSLRIRAVAGMPPHAVVGFNTREAIEHKRPLLVLMPQSTP
jgi:hyaluronate lyase